MGVLPLLYRGIRNLKGNLPSYSISFILQISKTRLKEKKKNVQFPKLRITKLITSPDYLQFQGQLRIKDSYCLTQKLKLLM